MLLAILCSLIRTNRAKSEEFALTGVYTFSMLYFFRVVTIWFRSVQICLKEIGTKINLHTWFAFGIAA